MANNIDTAEADDHWIFDAHLDLSMNAMEWNRDLRLELNELRESESNLKDKPDRGKGVVCFPEMRKGNIRLCVATLIARVEHDQYSPVFGWRSQEQAYAQTQGQWAWYKSMERCGVLHSLKYKSDLEQTLKKWNSKNLSGNTRHDPPIGYLLSLEGADSILDLDHLWDAWQRGLRAIGPAHYGPGVYAQGTDSRGGFTRRGRELLQEMDRIGFILDVTHLSDLCLEEALDLYTGPIWASHSNCRKLVHHQRQLSDRQIRKLAQRGAVIGSALDGWMLYEGWVRGCTTPEAAGITLQNWVDHIDHVSQITGSSEYSGLGSDLDGAFGYEQTPQDLKSISDLNSIFSILQQRGYNEQDVKNITHQNWVRFIYKNLP